MPPPVLSQLAATAAQVGILGFGGPAGQIALMRALYVERHGWLEPEGFDRGLGVVTLLPGPEAHQLATWIGWRLLGVPGALVSGVLFVLPGAVVMLGLSWLVAAFGGVGAVGGALAGAACAVLPLMVQGLMRIGSSVAGSGMTLALAVTACAGLLTGLVLFPVLIALGALAGSLLLKPSAGPGPPARDPGSRRLVLSPRLIGVTAAMWLVPLGLASLLLGPDHVLARIGQTMSTLAMVSFGGAYALLGWLAHVAVETEGWLRADQMLAGLALAETTPGPAVLVTQYVGFLAGWGAGGAGLAVAGALMASWCIFVPSMLWVFACAPLAARLQAMPGVAGALQGIQAAVTGILAALVISFAVVLLFEQRHVVPFGPGRLVLPELASLAPGPVAITVAASLAAWRGVHHAWIVVLAAAAGVILAG